MKITLGGWYQRTTLHLSEIHGFLDEGYSKLNLSKEKLQQYRQALNIKEVVRESSYLEYVQVQTEDEITIKYYEDGLYILEVESDDIKKSQQELKDYFENKFNPAISYIFSLGAPTPKILANIKTSHPTVVGIIPTKSEKFTVDEKKFGEVYSDITSSGIAVYKTKDYIFIIAKDQNSLDDLIEMQIFFREFKDQLEQYLYIHRQVWEEISEIREKRYIIGKAVEETSAKLENYQKIINLIGSRINQMSFYINARSSLAKQLDLEKHLTTLFQYKFETLVDTHSYIKEIWAMTKDYLSTALEVIRELEGQRINNSIRSIQILASVGVVAGILGYVTRDTLPQITSAGLIYFIVLLIAAWSLNYIISFIYKNLRYKVNVPEKGIVK